MIPILFAQGGTSQLMGPVGLKRQKRTDLKFTFMSLRPLTLCVGATSWSSFLVVLPLPTLSAWQSYSKATKKLRETGVSGASECFCPCLASWSRLEVVKHSLCGGLDSPNNMSHVT